MYDENKIITKQDKRYNKRRSLKNKWIKHGYWNSRNFKFLDKPTKFDRIRINKKLKII